MQILINVALILIGVLFFELIIFSHELGHFITAKLSGVKVNEFALGMGPRIFGFKKGETEYSFRLLPIGGYCAMEGEDEECESPRAFNNAKIWKRMIIIIAGAVMNILLGFILMFAYTVQADGYASTVITQFAPDSYTANSGLEQGDKIVNLNGYSIWNSSDLRFAIATMKYVNADGHTVTVYKQDCTNNATDIYRELARENKLEGDEAESYYKLLSNGCSKINKAQSKDEAYDYFTSLCKELYEYFNIEDYDIPKITEKDKRLRYISDVTVERNGEKIEIEDVQFSTYYASEEDKKANKPSIRLDFYVEGIEKNFGTVIKESFSNTCSVAKMVWTSLVWMVQGRFSIADMSGPVGIATVVTEVASQGLSINFASAVNNILYVMILITVNLGIVNMLPFPALDGGRFLFLLIEWIFKKPIPRKVEKIVNAAGFGLLMLFALIISFKDIVQLVTKSFPWMN